LDKIVGINAQPADANKLFQFAQAFKRNKKTLRAFCLLKSTQALVGKSTAVLKRDIEEIPWPKDNGDMTLAFWEQALLDDILAHTAQLIQVGQNAPVFTKQADEDVFEKYAALFTKMLGSVYKSLRPGRNGLSNGLAYQTFYAGAQCLLDWPDDWGEKLSGIIHKANSSIHTTRLFRIYEANTIIIIKPDRLRYWIPSTAIRDADETLGDLVEQGF
jgi:hypothetical protein